MGATHELDSGPDAMTPRLGNSRRIACALLSLLACALFAAPLAGQGVPAWTVGIDAGSGPRTARAGETYYRDDRARGVRLTAQLRLARARRVAPVLHLEGTHGGDFGQYLDCPFAPNGTCREYAPGNSGVGIGAGVALAPVRFIEASAIAGWGRYEGTGRKFVATRLALSPLRHVALTASLTHMTWKEPGGYPHWFRPLHVGLRIQ